MTTSCTCQGLCTKKQQSVPNLETGKETKNLNPDLPGDLSLVTHAT